ncbi:MAG TPA: hypothetical protein ENJ61_05125 [Aquifex aeolicus]|uniref:Uncharacterized protein n=1 Tax=Aquifex aeolicus TaxID=63363 RepID=A0A7C5Q343_AQUAO|nr:hypothetical protein [Aquifex aeolicus]
MGGKDRDLSKILVGLAVAGVAATSFLFTLYQFSKHPENRKHFIEKLRNVRNEAPLPIPKKEGE